MSEIYEDVRKEYYSYKKKRETIRKHIDRLQAQEEMSDDMITCLYGILTDYGRHNGETFEEKS